MRAKLEAWCKEKKHAHILVFVGALIVFGTFVTREGLGDRWKEEAEEIQTARSFGTVEGREAGTIQQVFFLKEDIAKIKDVVTHGGMYKDEYYAFLLESNTTSADVRGSLARISPIIQVLPDRESLSVRRNSILTRLLTNTDEIIKLESIDPKSENGMAVYNRETQLSDDLFVLREDADKLRDEILKSAADREHRAQRLSRYAWWISAFLFAVGWTLGLVGKLYGVPEAAGGS